jgi:hypothetical protein
VGFLKQKAHDAIAQLGPAVVEEWAALHKEREKI